MRASKYHRVYIFLQLLMTMNNHKISAQAIATYTVRMVNTLSAVSNHIEGRLEIYYKGTWGTVCDDGFTNANARVACASLGYGYIGAFIGNRHGAGTGKIWLDNVACTGVEYGLEKCQHSVWDWHNCNHEEDVSISCELSVRLINSVAGDVNSVEGQLEVFYSGAWGTVCDDKFTDTAAGVACASLGFGYTGKFIGNRYGTGRGQIWLDDVICNGTERSIAQCEHRTWGLYDCTRGELVSIKCDDTEEYAVRLINSQNPGRNPMEGRLEIYFAGVWGSVCDDAFTNITAKVVCASLGYGYEGTFTSSSQYGAGTGKIWLDDVICTGGEPGIDKCKHLSWGLHNCNHRDDVGIKCGIVRNFAMRLVNTLSHITNPKEGRLEICYSGSWGTVCDDNFTDFSATVVCASLGFGRIGKSIGKRHGPGTGQIVLDEVVCAGTEQSIDECSHSPWGRHDCTHNKDVSISCGTTTRLVNSLVPAHNSKEGRLEVYYGGVWGTVCSSRAFTETNAKVACASLGFGYNGTVIGNRHGNGTGKIWLDRVSCVGTEQSIDLCSRNFWGSHNCSHNEDVSIRCGETRDFSVRLINVFKNNSKEGRLEIYYSGIWGTVCDDDFTDISAKVACASLGFGYIGGVIGNRHGGGSDAIWLDDVKCNGTEGNIENCLHKGWGVHNCGHGEDVSISCGTQSSETVSTTSTTTQVTLKPTSMSASVPAGASSTPKPPLIMSTLSSSNSKASDSKAHEYTTSPQISMSTSHTSPSSTTTSKPTQKRITSLLLTSESTSTTTSPSRQKSSTTLTVTSTATTVVHVARGSSKKAPIASVVLPAREGLA